MLRFDVLKGKRIISHVLAENMSATIESAFMKYGYSVVGPYLVEGRGAMS